MELKILNQSRGTGQWMAGSMRYLRLLVITSVVLAVGFISWQVYLFTGRGTLSANVTPSDATATIDGKAYDATTLKDVTLKPGDHTLIVALDGFTTVEKTVSMGWQDAQSVIVRLQPKPFKEIYKYLSPDVGNENFEAVREKFFLNNTWATAYIVSGDDGEDISVAVIKRENRAWKLVYHNYTTDDDAKNLMPEVVYNNIKEFTR